MPKIYLEYHDHHNDPMIFDYESSEAAFLSILRNCEDGVGDEFMALFDEESDSYRGVFYYDGDEYHYVDADIMRARASGCLEIAERMDKNLSVYGDG